MSIYYFVGITFYSWCNEVFRGFQGRWLLHFPRIGHIVTKIPYEHMYWKIKKWCCHQFHVEKCFVDDWINFSWSSLPWFSSVPRCTNYFLGVRSESMTLLRCQSKRKTGFPVIICRALPSLRTENHFPLQLALELRGRSLTILTRLCKVHTYYGNMGWGLFKQGVQN